MHKSWNMSNIYVSLYLNVPLPNHNLLFTPSYFSFFTSPICPPHPYVIWSVPIPAPTFPCFSAIFHSSLATSTPFPPDPMCARCNKSWALKRSTSPHAGTGTKAPSAARRRKSLAKPSIACIDPCFSSKWPLPGDTLPRHEHLTSPLSHPLLLW